MDPNDTTTQLGKKLRRSDVEVGNEVPPTCFRETAHARFMGPGENRPGAVAVEQVLELHFMQHTPCSGFEWVHGEEISTAAV